MAKYEIMGYVWNKVYFSVSCDFLIDIFWKTVVDSWLAYLFFLLSAVGRLSYKYALRRSVT